MQTKDASMRGVLDVASSRLLEDQRPSEPDLRPFLAKAVEGSSRQKMVALLAEDNRSDVLIVEEGISLYGLPLALYVVEDGQKAFEFIERAEADPEAPCPQLLVLDLNLPKRSGREVLQRVRHSPKCKDIPVMIITSSNSPKDRKEMTQLGASSYFRKPSSYEEFLKVGGALKALLERDS